MSKYDQSGNDEDINESYYSVFKTSLTNLIIWRFFIVLCWVFLLTILPLMILSEITGMTFLRDFLANNSFLVTLGGLLITIYVNFFLLNYKFLVGNDRVIVYRFGYKGQKKIGDFSSSDYKFEFESVRGEIGGSIGFFFIKPKDKDGKRKRGKTFPTGLSRSDANAMHYTLEKLADTQ